MKAGKIILLVLLGVAVFAAVLPMSGCSILGIEKSEEESIGTVSSLEGAVDSRVLKEAIRIANNVRKTSYQSEAEVIESKGIYRFDSAGLVGYVLSRVAPDNYRRIIDGVDPPILPEDYYLYFTGLNASPKAPERGWSRITMLANARPGDILVIEHNQAAENSDNDHVLIIVDTPVPESNGEYSVWVVDSAESGHYRDNREKDGVGRGKMYFGVDQNGAPLYYRWKDASGGKIGQSLVGIAIGRAG